MSTYRAVWRVVATITVLLAAVATAFTMDLGVVFAAVFALAVFGSLIALTMRDELAHVRYPVPKGAALAAVPALVPGLSQVAGPAGTATAVVVAVASPWVVTRALRRVRPWLLPSLLVQAAMADEDDALRRQWAESTRQLQRATTVGERMVVVGVRQQILDDVAARSGGPLPSFVWESSHGRARQSHLPQRRRPPGPFPMW